MNKFTTLNKFTTCLLLTVAGSISLGTYFQEPDKVEPDSSKFMQRKLEYSKAIVGGLATEDFEEIAKAAQDLMLLSHESVWQVATTPEYLKASSDFRDTTARLRTEAREKNLDGATIAFFEVTLNCVRCHKQLRLKEARHK